MNPRRQRLDRAEAALREFLTLLVPKDPDLTDRLIRRFGTAGGVLEAGKYQLINAGLSPNNALLISMVPDILRHLETQRHGKHPKMRTLLQAEEYLKFRYIGINIEQFFLLAIDGSGKLIECVHIQSGDEESAPFYLKQVLSEVVRTKAAYAVIVHNHPNFTPQPSSADLDCTKTLMDALKVLETPLLDHLIMIGTRAMSVRGFGYIPEYIWSAQAAGNKILNGWLSGWSSEESAEALSPPSD